MEAIVEIKNRLGLHLRAASTLSQSLKPFTASVTLALHGKLANARSIISLMTLGAGLGAKLKVKIEGPDAEQALHALKQLFEQRFGEE